MLCIAIAVWHDDFGICDAYVPKLLASLADGIDRWVIVGNTASCPDELRRFLADDADFVSRPGVVEPMSCYAAGVAHLGPAVLAQVDELVLMTTGMFGPISGVQPVLQEMRARLCDYWAMHGVVPEDGPPISLDVAPPNIQPHFIVIRRPMIVSRVFADFWQKLDRRDRRGPTRRPSERFVRTFRRAGFRLEVYQHPADFRSPDPAILEPAAALGAGAPFLLREAIIGDPARMDDLAVDVLPVIDFLKSRTEYDVSLIQQHIQRVAPLRTLYTNLEMLTFLPSAPVPAAQAPRLAIAVFVHIFYVDMFEEIVSYISHIPAPYDLFISTDSVEKSADIERAAARLVATRTQVRVVAHNRGRDMAALFITFRDVALSGDYALAVRLHTKKSPQAGFLRAQHFKEHSLAGILDSTTYVSGIIDLFQQDPLLGLLMPPIVHSGFPTLGHAWFNNREATEALMQRLHLNVPLDELTPVAPYGTMFWFRPQALARLFEEKWEWEEYNKEPFHLDGGLAHVQERLIGYCAQAAGYRVGCVLPQRLAQKYYVRLEYKLQLLASGLNQGGVRSYYRQLEAMSGSTEVMGVRGAAWLMGHAMVAAGQTLLAKLRGRPRPRQRLVRWFNNRR